MPISDKLYERLIYDLKPTDMYRFWEAVAQALRNHSMNHQAQVAAIAIEAGLATLPRRG